MFLGLRTAVYYVNDIEKGKEWYASILGFPPYFDEPFYVGFNVAGLRTRTAANEGEANRQASKAAVYWGVESCEAALEALLAKGATANEDVQEVGGGIKVATVKDPFGNIFGVIENPHFKLSE